MFGKNNKIKNAFTLAEVLITLAVIGVVAAMAIPSLLSSTNKAELKTGLKEAYSTIYQAVNRMKLAEGGQLDAKYNGNGASFKPEFIKYFNVSKDCNLNDCVSTISPSSIYKKYSRDAGISMGLMDDGQFILDNGMTIFIENYSAPRGILISVDVNGHNKNPNILGQDLFTFELMEDDTIKPAGTDGTGERGIFGSGFAKRQDLYCDSASTNGYNGVACTAKALSDESYWNNLP